MKIRILLLSLMIMPVLYAFGEPPTFNTDNLTEQDIAKKIQLETATPQANVEQLPENDVFELNLEYEKALKRNMYAEALGILNRIPEYQWTQDQHFEKDYLEIFVRIEDEFSNETADFFQEDDLSEDTQRTIKRLYRESQAALLRGDDSLAADLLIHSLYLHRRNYRAKKLLDYGLGMKPGSYKVENVEQKYWKKSDVLFYGGNYGDNVEALNVLTYFDNENPLIYERMGSSYYMLAEDRKAVSSWKTALFLDPERVQLQEYIDKAELKIKEEEDRLLALELEKQDEEDDAPAEQVEKQVLGVFPNQTAAFNFAQQIRQEGYEPFVDEQDDGRWKVSVERGATPTNVEPESPAAEGDAVDNTEPKE